MTAVGSAIFMATIDSSIVNIALPTLQKDLKTSFALIQWVVLSYLLTITGLVLIFARLGDMLGKKRIYNIGFVAFTLASALCGLAPNIEWLIGFRALQGIGGAVLQALGIAIVTEAFPAQERGKALGIVGTLVSFGIALGPGLGGLIIGAVGWRAIFLVNVPIGIVGTYLCWRFVPNIRPRGKQRFDLAGAVLLTATFVSFALAMTLGQEVGFGESLVVALLAVAGVAIGGFIWIETRAPQPMIDLQLFRNPLMSVGLYTAVSVFVILPGIVLFPFYLENVQDHPIEAVGLIISAFPVALGIIAPIAGQLSDRFGTRGLALLGLVVILFACLEISTLQEDSSTLGFIIRLFILGAGIGLFQSPNNSAIMGTAPREQLGVVSGLLASSRNIGQVAGLPILGTIFALRVADVTGQQRLNISNAADYAIIEGLQATYLFAAGVVLVAIAVSLYGMWLERQHHRHGV